MKRYNLNGNIIAVLIMALLLTISLAMAAAPKDETAGYLNLFGKIKSAGIVPHDLVITVFKDGVKKEAYAIDETTGQFDIKLPLDGIYYLNITGYTMISKTIEVNTTVPAEFWYCEYEYKFNVNLTGGYQPDDQDGRLKQPVVKIAYAEKYDGFDYDREYDKLISEPVLFGYQPVKCTMENGNCGCH